MDSDSEHDLLLRLAMRALSDAGLASRLHGSSSSSSSSVDDAAASSLRNRMGIVSGCLSFPRDRTQGDVMKVYQDHFARLLAGDKAAASGDTAGLAGAEAFDRMYYGADSKSRANAE